MPIANRTADNFSMFFLDETRYLALPPYYTGRDVSADWPRFGNQLHADIEHHLNGLPPLCGTPGTKEWGHFLAVHESLTRDGYVPFRTELSISSIEYAVCGQIDALYRRASDGRIVMLDWKSTDKIVVADDETKDGDYDPAKRMADEWSHMADTSRNGYVVQLNVYRELLRIGPDALEVGAAFLVVINRRFDSYVLVRVRDFRDDPTDHAAFRTMFEKRKSQLRSSQNAVVHGTDPLPEPESFRDLSDPLPESVGHVQESGSVVLDRGGD